MKYGVREICDVVLRAKSTMKVGNKTFYKNEPVLYFDTLTTSSLEGAATTVYATGGKGNPRILAWEGERTLTFNMTDALISPESFSVLSGADVIDATDNAPIFVHTTCRTVVGADNKIEIEGEALWNHTHHTDDDHYNAGADIFIMDVTGGDMSMPAIPFDVDLDYTTSAGNTILICKAFAEGKTVLVDYYVAKKSGKQIEITPDKFGGYFYLEASTLWRSEETGEDMPAEFIIPRCKVQSNFTFTMAATGDPSTFDFVLDAFPDYSKFNTKKKVLAILQVIEENSAAEDGLTERRHEPNLRADQTGEGASFDHKTNYDYHDAGYPEDATTDPYASANFSQAQG